MLIPKPLHRLQIWLFCAALFSAQLVLADHAYQHDSDPHPASCELCLQGSAGHDDGDCRSTPLVIPAAGNAETPVAKTSPVVKPAPTAGYRPRAPPQI